MKSPVDIYSVRYVAPVFTPRDKTGALNYDIIPQYVNYLINNGVQGVLVGGSAGEGILQSNTERIDVVKAFIRAIRGEMIVIVHAGGVNFDDTISLCETFSAMEEIDGIMLSAPIFYPYYNYAAFEDFLVDAGRSCHGKPVLFYHFPSLTRLEYDIVETVASLKTRLPNFIGLKYTADDVRIYKTLVRMDVKIFLGFPSMTLAGAETQGREVSLITGTTNFANGLMMRIVDNVVCGDVKRAEILQKDLNDLMNKVVVEKELMASMSHVIEIIGIPMGQPTRPLGDLTINQKQMMENNLQQLASDSCYKDLLDVKSDTLNKPSHDSGFVFYTILQIGIFSMVMWLTRR